MHFRYCPELPNVGQDLLQLHKTIPTHFENSPQNFRMAAYTNSWAPKSLRALLRPYLGFDKYVHPWAVSHLGYLFRTKS
jgi:hypothetical protein